MWKISVLSHCTCWQEVFIPITSLKHSYCLTFYSLGGKKCLQRHLFRVEKMEQNSSFYSKHHYLAVFAFAQQKAAILIFCSQSLPQVFSSIVRWIGLHFACWDAFFFLCWNRNILKVQLRINVIVIVWLKSFNLGISLCWLCWLSNFIDYLTIRQLFPFLPLFL